MGEELTMLSLFLSVRDGKVNLKKKGNRSEDDI